VTEVVVAEDERRIDGVHAAERRLRFVESSQLTTDHADVVEDGDAVRIVRARLAERVQCSRRIVELSENGAQVAGGGGEGRHQVGGTLKGVARLRHVVVDEPQLAALIGDRCPLRRERDGAVQRVARRGAVAILATRARERQLRDR